MKQKEFTTTQINLKMKNNGLQQIELILGNKTSAASQITSIQGRKKL